MKWNDLHGTFSLCFGENCSKLKPTSLSNKSIRQKLTNLSIKENFEPIFPPVNLCSDNAAMIAMVGLEKYKLGIKNKLDFPAKPRWPLDEKAAFLKGAGVKL